MALWSTELPTQVSTRCISWCTALITLPPYLSVVWKFWEPPCPGNLRAFPGLCMDFFGLCESCDVSHTMFFCSFFYHCIYGCMLCTLLFNFVNYVLYVIMMYSYCYVYVFSCYVCSVLGILFHCIVLCIVCV